MGGPHLSLSLSRELWNEMLRAALPFHLAGGDFSLKDAARSALLQLQVRERVTGLLEDQRTPQPLVKFSHRALEVWRDNRSQFFRRLDELVRVEGDWRFEIDDLGTELSYAPQRVAADAFVKAIAEGKITLLRENVTLPFRIEKRVGATVALGRIRFSRDKDAVIGNVQDLAVHLGDNVVLQLLSRLIEYGVEQRIDTVQPVPVLKREQVEGLVGGLGGAMHLNMGVDDLQLDIDDDQMTLHVRFGFTRMPDTQQIPQRGEA
ncbi:MAG: hypothetical protein H6733_03020 [Alphaproteobacteria bacterium]|nr:hypothetical protein [Alphaproteobacteria bacterium]